MKIRLEIARKRTVGLRKKKAGIGVKRPHAKKKKVGEKPWKKSYKDVLVLVRGLRRKATIWRRVREKSGKARRGGRGATGGDDSGEGNPACSGKGEIPEYFRQRKRELAARGEKRLADFKWCGFFLMGIRRKNKVGRKKRGTQKIPSLGGKKRRLNSRTRRKSPATCKGVWRPERISRPTGKTSKKVPGKRRRVAIGRRLSLGM